MTWCSLCVVIDEVNIKINYWINGEKKLSHFLILWIMITVQDYLSSHRCDTPSSRGINIYQTQLAHELVKCYEVFLLEYTSLQGLSKVVMHLRTSGDITEHDKAWVNLNLNMLYHIMVNTVIIILILICRRTVKLMFDREVFKLFTLQENIWFSTMIVLLLGNVMVVNIIIINYHLSEISFLFWREWKLVFNIFMFK